jgi:hypothetical protein
MEAVRKYGSYILLACVCVAIMAASSFNPAVSGVSLFGMAYVLTDLKWTQGQQNLGCIVGDIYYCPVEDILTFPVLTAAGSLETAAASNFVCKTGKEFISIYHTPETGKIDDNVIGEIDGKGFENFLDFFFPGSKLAVRDFTRFALNTPCVVIAKNTNGQYEIIGVVNLDETTTTLTGDIPAYLQTANGTTGAARADRRGRAFQFRQPGCPHPPIIYKGTIPLTPAA